MPKIYKSPEADSIPFDVGTTDLTEEQVGPAIRELAATVGVSASPGFNFGKSANVSVGTWLQVTGGVPSNRAGITVALAGPTITNIYIANEDISTFDIQVYEHEGNEVNLTALGSPISVTAARSATAAVSIPVTSGRQLAVRLVSGSAKNLNVGLQLSGSSS